MFSMVNFYFTLYARDVWYIVIKMWNIYMYTSHLLDIYFILFKDRENIC